MSAPIRQRRELAAVPKTAKPTRLVDGMPWTEKNNAESHGDINNFLQRQIARGLKVRQS